MTGMDGERRFNMIRRNSLRNEVDGSFDELEDFEDHVEGGFSFPKINEVTHQECVLLNRIITDKSRLPPVCYAPSDTTGRLSNLKETSPDSAGDGVIGSLVRRLTGAVPGAFSMLDIVHASKKELGGVVTTDQCRTLAEYLSPSVGGIYLMPGACTDILKLEEEKLSKQYDKENAEVYARLKKRQSIVAKDGYPPTMC